MVINIDNKEVTLRYTLRGYMIFEQITDHSFTGKNISDFITLFYSMVMASDDTLTIEFDAFIDLLDSRPELLNEFSMWVTDCITKQNNLAPKKKERKTTKSDSKNS